MGCIILLLIFEGNLNDNSLQIFTFLVLSYPVGLVYHKILDVILSFVKVKSRFYSRLTEFKGDETKRMYYDAYYNVTKNKCLLSVPALEAQSAFIRNIWPLLIVFLVMLLVNEYSCDSIFAIFPRQGLAIIITILILVLPLTRWYIETQIINLIGDTDDYLKKQQSCLKAE